jgi:tRNA nucleotidyltransferase (CCA-adding enzyme)
MLDAYVSKLIPPAYDRSTVAARKQDIRAALEQGGVDIVNEFEAGSFSHGTGIKGKADVDLMIWVSVTQQPQLPSSVLNRFKTALSTYLSAHAVGVSTPVVKTEFWSPPHFEVVPAFYETENSGVDVYEIEVKPSLEDPGESSSSSDVTSRPRPGDRGRPSRETASDMACR